MKRLLFGLMFGFCTVLNAKNLTSINEIYKLTDKQISQCTISGFTLMKIDDGFKKILNSKLNSFSTLKATDFDMSECLSKKNLQPNVVTTYFWQKNQKFMDQNLTSYIAYDYLNKKMLVVLLDNDLNTYLIGDKDNYLIEALKNSKDANDVLFGNINWNSENDFKNLGSSNSIPSKDDLIQMEQKKLAILKNDLLCKTVFDIAENVMQGRQAGIPKETQIQMNNQSPYSNSDLKKYEVLLIDKAYASEIFVKPLDKFAYSKGFAYQSFFECRKSFS